MWPQVRTPGPAAAQPFPQEIKAYLRAGAPVQVGGAKQGLSAMRFGSAEGTETAHKDTLRRGVRGVGGRLGSLGASPG